MKKKDCPTCNNKRKKNNITKQNNIKPEMLYRRVLEIGSECITCGISFNSLYTDLVNENFDLENGCLKRCLREWFWNSFFHEEVHCNSGTYDKLSDLDKHANCKFVLRSESCMKLLTFRDTETNYKSIKLSNRTALIGLLVAILTLCYSLWKDNGDNLEQEKRYQVIKELLEQEIYTAKTLTTKLDNVIPNIEVKKGNIPAYKVEDKNIKK